MATAEEAAAAAEAAARAARDADLQRLLTVLLEEGFDTPVFSALVPDDPGAAWNTAAAGRYASDLEVVRSMVRDIAAAASTLAADARAELARG